MWRRDGKTDLFQGLKTRAGSVSVFLVGIRYFSVFVIPTSISVSVLPTQAYSRRACVSSVYATASQTSQRLQWLTVLTDPRCDLVSWCFWRSSSWASSSRRWRSTPQAPVPMTAMNSARRPGSTRQSSATRQTSSTSRPTFWRRDKTITAATPTQTPLVRFVVDLLDNKSYNKLYNSFTCQDVVCLCCVFVVQLVVNLLQTFGFYNRSAPARNY